MSKIMELLYYYAQKHLVSGFLDPQEYAEIERLEEENLALLKNGLTAAQLERLEKYQDARQERSDMDLEAMFQTGFSVARELCR